VRGDERDIPGYRIPGVLCLVLPSSLWSSASSAVQRGGPSCSPTVASLRQHYMISHSRTVRACRCRGHQC
jgi:hypothetical protein